MRMPKKLRRNAKVLKAVELEDVLFYYEDIRPERLIYSEQV